MYIFLLYTFFFLLQHGASITHNATRLIVWSEIQVYYAVAANVATDH